MNMSIKRQKQLEKEAEEQGLTTTKDLKVDESSLEEDQKEKTNVPVTFIIISGVLLLLIAVCITFIILANKGVFGS